MAKRQDKIRKLLGISPGLINYKIKAVITKIKNNDYSSLI